MELTKNKENDITTIYVRGDLDATSSIEMDQAMKEEFDNGIYHLMINTQELHYISSAGIGAFVSNIEEIKKNDGKLVFYGMNESVFSVFQVLGLDKIISITKNELDARRLFAQN